MKKGLFEAQSHYDQRMAAMRATLEPAATAPAPHTSSGSGPSPQPDLNPGHKAALAEWTRAATGAADKPTTTAGIPPTPTPDPIETPSTAPPPAAVDARDALTILREYHSATHDQPTAPSELLDEALAAVKAMQDPIPSHEDWLIYGRAAGHLLTALAGSGRDSDAAAVMQLLDKHKTDPGSVHPDPTGDTDADVSDTPPT